VGHVRARAQTCHTPERKPVTPPSHNEGHGSEGRLRLPPRAFISYRRTDEGEARAVGQALRRAGVRPWRDLDDLAIGRPTEQEIRQAIRTECGGAVLWLSRAALESDFIMELELPEIVRQATEGGFVVVPVFRDMSPNETADLVRTRTGLEIGGYNGEVVHGDHDVPAAVRRIAAAYVLSAIGPLGSAALAARPTIRAVTRDDTAGSLDAAALDFDWRNAYTDPPYVPDPLTQLDLKDSLGASVSTLLAAHGQGDIRLDIKVHLSVAVALGHALRRPTGAVPVILHEEGEWRAIAGNPESPEPALEEELEIGPVGADALAAELSVSQSVREGVDPHIARRGEPYRARVRFSPPGGPSQTALVSPEQANAWAEQVVTRIVAVRSELQALSTSLFIAAPLPLAVLLGWRLNAVGPVVMHEWASNVGPYIEAWSLP
jgi:hypothetical protein